MEADLNLSLQAIEVHDLASLRQLFYSTPSETTFLVEGYKFLSNHFFNKFQA